MTKSRKNLFLVALTIVLALSMAIFAGVVKPARAEGEVPTSFDAQTFYMDGADVRLAEPVGLGFKTSINKAMVDTLGDKVLATGTIIMPSYYVEDLGYALTLEGAAQVKADLNKNCVVENNGYFNRKSATDAYQFRGSIIVNAANYTLDFSACSYVTYIDAEGETQTLYAQNPVTANAKAIALPFAKDAAFMAEYAETAVETQINAYVSAWDFDAKLFDPENDWRRLSYGGVRYGYDRVVDASTLNFGGKAYTGKAVKLDTLVASTIALNLSGEYYDDIITSGEYTHISMYIALAHSNLEVFNTGTNNNTWLSSDGLFGGTSSKLYRSISLTDKTYFHNWFKISVPVQIFAADTNGAYNTESTIMELIRPYTASTSWGEDSEKNYTIYIGEILAETIDDTIFDATYGTIGQITSSTTTGGGIRLTEEQLDKISGDYNGGAYMVSVSMNTYNGYLYHNENVENAIKKSNNKYVLLNLAVLSETTTAKSYGTGWLRDALNATVKVGPSTVDGVTLPTNTWMQYYIPVSNLLEYKVDSNGSILFIKANGSQSSWVDFNFVFGDIKLVESAPAASDNVIVVTREVPTVADITAPFEQSRSLAFTTVKDANEVTLTSVTDATATELNNMNGYGSFYNGTAKYGPIYGAKVRYQAYGDCGKWSTQHKFLNNSNYPALYEYKYVTMYIAVTGDAEKTLTMGASGVFYAANDAKLSFGKDGYALNTWYQIVIPVADYVAASIGTWEGLLLFWDCTVDGTAVSATNGGQFTFWLGDCDIVKDAPAGYDGTSCMIAPAAQA